MAEPPSSRSWFSSWFYCSRWWWSLLHEFITANTSLIRWVILKSTTSTSNKLKLLFFWWFHSLFQLLSTHNTNSLLFLVNERAVFADVATNLLNHWFLYFWLFQYFICWTLTHLTILQFENVRKCAVFTHPSIIFNRVIRFRFMNLRHKYYKF